jgi:hypothetical protein
MYRQQTPSKNLVWLSISVWDTFSNEDMNEQEQDHPSTLFLSLRYLQARCYFLSVYYLKRSQAQHGALLAEHQSQAT